jgi:TonB family protein
MPPDWVNSFVYVDGHFRVVGGAYPFWAQDLEWMRRPVSADVEGRVQSARVIHQVAPKYRKEARKKHVEGVVLLRMGIAKDGSTHDIEVIHGDRLLVNAAIEAVRQWRFTPTTLNGQPVDAPTEIEVAFRLSH